MKRILFIACCSIYKIVTDILQLNGEKYELVGFIDDDDSLTGREFNGLPVLGTFNNIDKVIRDYKVTDAVICLPEGYVNIRKKYFELCVKKGLNLSNYIHPSAVVSSNVKIGSGVIICTNVAINPGSIIGDNVIIWTGATIDHDNYISSHVYISPGVHTAGSVTIGECTMVGTGAIITPLVHIGRNVKIGAASMVNKDIPNNSVAYGIPAKVIRENK
jgi:sugar O-acyltransferase (sialic acid O-acetyltransferase NeuD family)